MTPVAAVAVTVTVTRLTLYWTAARYSVVVAANVGRSVPELMLSALSVASCASTTSGNATVATTIKRPATAEIVRREPSLRAARTSSRPTSMDPVLASVMPSSLPNLILNVLAFLAVLGFDAVVAEIDLPQAGGHLAEGVPG